MYLLSSSPFFMNLNALDQVHYSGYLRVLVGYSDNLWNNRLLWPRRVSCVGVVTELVHWRTTTNGGSPCVGPCRRNEENSILYIQAKSGVTGGVQC